MGRKALIPEIEQRFGKPIKDIVEPLYAAGRLKMVSESLRVSIGTAHTLVKAAKLDKGTYKAICKPLKGDLVELINDFVMAKGIGGRSQRTQDNYRSNLTRFTWWLQEVARFPLFLGSFNTKFVRQFLYYLQTEPIRFGGKTATARRVAHQATIDTYWRSFHAFGNWLVREGKIIEEDMPTRHIDQPGAPEVIIPDIPDEVLDAIFASCNGSWIGKRNRAIYSIFLATGVRRTELADIKCTDMNLEAGEIKVLGKGNKERMVYLVPEAIEAITEYMAACPHALSWLWVTEQGERLTSEAIKDMITSLRVKLSAKFPELKLSAHTFRHAWAMRHLRAKGGDPYTLKQLGGWTDLTMPLRYAQAAEGERAKVAAIKANPLSEYLKRNGHDTPQTESDPLS